MNKNWKKQGQKPSIFVTKRCLDCGKILRPYNDSNYCSTHLRKYWRVDYNGINKRNCKRWNDNEINYIKNTRKKGINAKEVSNNLSRTLSAVYTKYRKLKNNNGKKINGI
jgi:hypothetical protein